MKKIIQLFLFFCLSFSSFGQNMKGQWRGFFNDVDNSISLLRGNTEYVLEIEINGDSVSGTSYTYFNNHQYFVICNLNGIYNKKSKRIVVNETERIKGSTPFDWNDCLQTHILYYTKEEGKELLTGEWKTSPYQKRANGGCGYGATTLSRRILSNPFVFNKKNAPAKKTENKLNNLLKDNNKTKPPVVKNTAKPTIKPITKPTVKPTIPPVVKNKPAIVKPKPLVKPTTPPVVKNNTVPPVIKTNPKVPSENKIPTQPITKTDEKLKPNNNINFNHRAENILKTIEIEKDSFTVNLYDNGEIDGDSISLFYNGKLILQHQRLSEKAITVTLNVNNKNGVNELEMYAENLGTIPPNTALMVVTDSGKRYEVFITSDLEKSGVIRFIHKPKSSP